MFEWFDNTDVEEYTGDPVANAFQSGKHTEIIEGDVEIGGEHRVYVTKRWEKDGEESYWLIKVDIPHAMGTRTIKEYYKTQFEADAVFEKLKREYDLTEYEPEDNSDA